MPVPGSINDLSVTAGSNSPYGGEPALPQMDDYMRALSSFVAQLRDGKLEKSLVSAFALTLLDDADAAAMRATLGAAGFGANTFTGAQTLPGNATAALHAVPKQQLDAATAGLSDGLAQPGDVKYTARTTAPSGWLIADGRAISRTTYANLFAAIGTTYGAGDGSTTFNIPDLRGEFIRALDAGRGLDGGRTIGSVQGDAMRNLTGSFGYHAYANWANGVFASAGDNRRSGTGNDDGSAGATTTFDASRQVPVAGEFRPRNVALLAVIKT